MEDMRIEITGLRMEDFRDLKESMRMAYGSRDAYWPEESIEKLLQIFPEGQICVKVNDKVVGTALSIIVDYNRFGDEHTYEQITGNYTFSTHDPKGDTLYGIEVYVHPDHRGKRLARRLYNTRKELCERLNLKAIVAGGRLPNYIQHADSLTTKQYIEKVKSKEVFDPTLSFQLSNDFHVKRILKGYLPGDRESMEYGALIEWINVYYEPKRELINSKKSTVRLALVQWQMRAFANFDAVCEQIEYFVDVASGYQSDFILFPEYFHAPLMADYNHLPEPDAIRELAVYTERLRTKFTEFSISYNTNIITGSMPVINEGKLNNIGFLCRRNGTYETYEKLHVTPAERLAWGMSGGKKIQTYETDCGKIGILICYDVEFPELARLLAEEGMTILFVPFQTDTQSAYTRVRYCAQARAIENECYVAIAGSVGNIPRVHNMDIQFAQSAVFTPSDYTFPVNAVSSEATPNTEMALIVDVDLDLLKELHFFGSVRTLSDRRTDMYKVIYNRQNEIQVVDTPKPEPAQVPAGRRSTG